MKKNILSIVLIMLIVSTTMGCARGTFDFGLNPKSETVYQDRSEDEIYDVSSNDSGFLNTYTQFEIIMNNIDMWWPEETGSSITVSDLDQNGRLEIISSICEGSGGYSTNYIFEVNESQNGLDKVLIEADEGYLPEIISGDLHGPDLIQKCVRVYEKSGDFTYIFNDYSQSGLSEQACSVDALCLQKGTLNVRILESMTMEEIYNDSEICSVVYMYNSLGEMVGPSDYKEIVEKENEGSVEKSAFFDWEQVDAKEDVTEDVLKELFVGFNIVDEKVSDDAYYYPEKATSNKIIYAGILEPVEYQLDTKKFLSQLEKFDGVQATNSVIRGDDAFVMSIKDGYAYFSVVRKDTLEAYVFKFGNGINLISDKEGIIHALDENSVRPSTYEKFATNFYKVAGSTEKLLNTDTIATYRGEEMTIYQRYNIVKENEEKKLSSMMMIESIFDDGLTHKFIIDPNTYEVIQCSFECPDGTSVISNKVVLTEFPETYDVIADDEFLESVSDAFAYISEFMDGVAESINY